MKYIKTYEENQASLNRKLVNTCSKISSLQAIRDLIKKGANVNHKNVLGDTPLIEASKKLFSSAIKLLLENGADPNIVNDMNETGLIIISQFGSYIIQKNLNIIQDIIDLFIQYNIDLNIRSIGIGYVHNYTALDYSSEIKEYIEKTYPEKYEEYLIKQNIEKYNL